MAMKSDALSPKAWCGIPPPTNFTANNLEVESSNIEGMGKFTGRFEWKVFHNGEVVASAYNNINILTSNLHGGMTTLTA